VHVQQLRDFNLRLVRIHAQIFNSLKIYGAHLLTMLPFGVITRGKIAPYGVMCEVTKAIEIPQKVQQVTEELYISADESVLRILPRETENEDK
jgi:hypothetical protein